jgi:hypothetical protein
MVNTLEKMGFDLELTDDQMISISRLGLDQHKFNRDIYDKFFSVSSVRAFGNRANG